MDLNMPRLNGMETTKKIRQYEIDNDVDKVVIIMHSAIGNV